MTLSAIMEPARLGLNASVAAVVGAAALWMASPASAANTTVANEAQLVNAINGAGSGDTITFTANITLTANLPNIAKNLTINGGNFTLSGNDQYRGLFVQEGSVAISNLTIADAKAQGGNGGYGLGLPGGTIFQRYPGGSGGGGGAGLGGALFVSAGTNVTVNNVTLRDSTAVGGNGGTSLKACCAASGGGGGYWPFNANGQPGSSLSGSGGSGGGGNGASYHTGESGGFGGGGGGGWGNKGQAGGGNGGFGGGGGGGSDESFGGLGGFLGANGATGGITLGGNGGSGAGMGGAIFVQEGGKLLLGGSLTISGNKVAGGAGNPTGAAGSGIFLQGNGSLSAFPAANETQTISDAIVDQTGAGGSGANAGSWEFVKSGAGTTVLTGINAYSGGTKVVGGLLRFATDRSLGTAGTGVTLNGASIGTTADTPANTVVNRSLTLIGSGNVDVANNPLTWSGIISGQSQFTKTGPGDLSLTGANTYTGGTLVSGGVLRFAADASLGAAGTGITLNGGSVGTTSGTPADTSINRSLTLAGAGGVDVANNPLIWSGNISGSGQFIKSGSGELTFAGTNTYTGGTLVTGGVLRFTGESSLSLGAPGTAITLNGGSIGTITDTPANTSVGRSIILAGAGGIDVALHPLTWAGSITGGGRFIKSGDGELWLTGTTTYTGGTLVQRGTLRVDSDDKLGAAGGLLTLRDNGGLRASETFTSARNVQLEGAGGVFLVDAKKALTLSGSVGGSGSITKVGAGALVLAGTSTYGGNLNINGGTVEGNASTLRGNIVFDTNKDNLSPRSVTFDQEVYGSFERAISGIGSIAKTGGGTLFLSGNNSYTGGTSVLEGTLFGTTRSLQGHIVNDAKVGFDQSFDGTYAGNMTGDGALWKLGTGKVTLTGTNSIGGGTTIYNGGLSVNGTLKSNVTIANESGVLYGSGNVIGNITNKGGRIEPGNSIGHMVVDGNFTFDSGTLVVEIDPQGDSDRISVIGAGHKVMINAGLLQIKPTAGTYAPNTKYTIITTESGGTVWLGDVAGGVGFLTPEVSLDGGVISVTLALPANAFRRAGQTVNQQAVGSALDSTAASGNVGGLITAMANLPVSQGGAALQALSGQPYADFGTMNTRGSQLFMNAVGRQMAVDRGAGMGGAKRIALADACDVACDGAASRFGAWASAIGSTGNVLGDGNAAGLTYTFGGTAFGIDYRPDPRFLVGIAGGYVSGTQWVNGFTGNGYTDAFNVALYGSFDQAGFYVDALAGYANASNRLQRVINVAGLPAGMANGSTSSNQFLGQVETGYRIGLDFPANTSISPFARLQVGAASQAGFTESGASFYNLAVAAQNTTSVRSTLGVDLAAGFDLGGGTPLSIGLRLGWLHEYADTARPMTAAFAAAPASQFTAFGATPQRNSAVLGLSAVASVSETMSLFLNYDGELGGGTDNHALRAGFRLTW